VAIDGLTAALRGGQMSQGEARGIGAPGAPGAPRSPSSGTATGGSDFAKALEDAIGEVDDKQRVADSKSMALIRGEDIPIHDVMVAVTDAELAVQMTTAVAAKAIAAYQEIWRMEV